MTALADNQAERGGPGPKGRQPKRAMPASVARGLIHEPPHPPIPLDIYSISVFTHLNEKMQLEWLKELSRILKPNGYAIVSVHGEFHRQIKQSEIEILEGFKFKVLEKGIFKRDGLPDFYQDAQHTRNYIMKVWSRYFDVVNYIEKGINGHQDAVVLKSK
jgi:ubiquinone/menaquinone biosynthesis C-methylase UbiE